MNFIAFIAQVFVAVLAAFLAAWFATSRFRKERLWERKVTRYEQLVDALHNMKWTIHRHFQHEVGEGNLTDEEMKELWREFRLSKRELWRIADSASFLLSNKVEHAVRELERELDESAESPMDQIQSDYEAIDNCLFAVKQIGTRDLGIRSSIATRRAKKERGS